MERKGKHACRSPWPNHSVQIWFHSPIAFAGHGYNGAAATAQPVIENTQTFENNSIQLDPNNTLSC